MAVLAHLQAPQRTTDRRVAVRRKLTLEAQGIVRQEAASVLIHDVSATGMLLQAQGEIEVGEEIEVSMPESGRVNATVVWHSGSFLGCEFERPISRASMSAAILRGAPSSSSLAGLLGEAADNAAPAHDYPMPESLTLGRKLWIIIALALLAWVGTIAILARLF